MIKASEADADKNQNSETFKDLTQMDNVTFFTSFWKETHIKHILGIIISIVIWLLKALFIPFRTCIVWENKQEDIN